VITCARNPPLAWLASPPLKHTLKVAAFVDEVHSTDQRFVVIVDPGILSVDPSWGFDYKPFSDAIKGDLFVKDGFTGQPYVAQVLWRINTEGERGITGGTQRAGRANGIMKPRRLRFLFCWLHDERGLSLTR